MTGSQLFKGHVEREADMAGQGIGETPEWGVVGQRRPGRQGAFAQRQLRVANEYGWVGSTLHAQSLTRGTPAERTIEGEMVRVQRLETAATAVASKMLAIALDFPGV